MRWPEWPEALHPGGIGIGPRERRTVAVGGVLAVVLLAYGFLTAPAPPSDPDVEAGRRALYARLTGLAAQGDRVHRSWERARSLEVELRERLLPGEKPSLAGVALSRLVRGMAERSAVEVERVSVGDARPLGEGLEEVPVDVDMAGDVYGLREFFVELDDAGPTLSAANLRITSSAGTSLSEPGGDGPPLRIQMSIVGYALGPDSSSAQGSTTSDTVRSETPGAGAQTDETRGEE